MNVQSVLDIAGNNAFMIIINHFKLSTSNLDKLERILCEFASNHLFMILICGKFFDFNSNETI